MTRSEAEERIGSEIHGYRIEALIGRGATSAVYRAWDPRLKRKVALKLLARDLSENDRFRARLLREQELAASIHHPHVVPIYDAGDVEGQLYIAMRYVEGGDLRNLLAGSARLSPERAIAITAEIADALDSAHELGLVHRDVKPSNILLDDRGHAYLADFGLTKSADQAVLTSAGEMIGTVAYVAPEQIRGDELDGRADVYSLGCVLYECLTGEVPFPRRTELAIVYAHLEEPPPRAGALRPELSQAIDAVVAKGLAKSPAERYSTAEELVGAAREALAVEGVAPAVQGQRLLAVGLLALLTAVVATLAAYYFTRDSGGMPTGKLIRIQPATGRVAGSVTVGSDPRAIAAARGSVWAASFRDGTLWQIDAATNSARRIPVVGRPRDVVLLEGAAYVASDGPGLSTGNLSKYDARSGGRLEAVEQLIVCSLGAGGAGLWTAGCPNVQQISLDPFAVARTVAIPYQRPLRAANYREELVDIAVGETAVWVLGDAADRRLWRIDSRSGRIGAILELPFVPAGIAVGAGAVWVTAQLDDVVVKIDPGSGRIVRTIPVGRGASAVAVGGGSVWVAESIDGTVSRIDPKTNEVSTTIRVGDLPESLGVGGGSVWVGIRSAR